MMSLFMDNKRRNKKGKSKIKYGTKIEGYYDKYSVFDCQE